MFLLNVPVLLQVNRRPQPGWWHMKLTLVGSPAVLVEGCAYEVQSKGYQEESLGARGQKRVETAQGHHTANATTECDAEPSGSVWISALGRRGCEAKRWG